MIKLEKIIEITLNQRKYQLLDKENILNIYLFGSYARNENDKYSDIDIFVLCKEKSESLKKYLSEKLNIPIKWLSLYDIETISKMFEEGSLFLWHIKNEGKLLYANNEWFENQLTFLKKYKKVKKDLLEYKKIITDINNSIARNYGLEYYEISLIGILLRNIAIIHCHINGYYLFGRLSAFKKSQSLRKKNRIDLSLYNSIYEYRIHLNRKSIKKYNLKKCNLIKLLSVLEDYIEEVIENVI